MNEPAVIIPARNEGAVIGAVVAGIKMAVPLAVVVVVDDASTDDTALQAKRAGATVLSSKTGLGIGGAVQLGVRYAYERGHSCFVRMDGDGQHDARYIAALIERTRADTLTIGSRSRESFAATSDWSRRLGSRCFVMLFKKLLRIEVPDPTSGYLCFGRTVARQFAAYYPTDYPEIESTALLCRAGFTIASVPVVMRPRSSGASSITLFRALIYMVSVTLAFLLSLIRKNPYSKTE